MYTNERDMEDLFGRYGKIDSITIIRDRQVNQRLEFLLSIFASHLISSLFAGRLTDPEDSASSTFAMNMTQTKLAYDSAVKVALIGSW